MAMKKSAGETKAKEASIPGKVAAKSNAPKKVNHQEAADTAESKKAAGPKLTDAQKAMLRRVTTQSKPSGYHTDKKSEHMILETLLKHKLVKRGKKHPQTKLFHYKATRTGTDYFAIDQSPRSSSQRDPRNLTEQEAHESDGAASLAAETTSADAWVARWRAWAQSHSASAVIADDSRESIYAGRGE